MALVLYLTDRLGVHDDRFTGVLRADGHQVVRATAAGSDQWDVEDEGPRRSSELAERSFDVVQVGPLTLAEDSAPFVDRFPIVTVCWGSDVRRAPSPALRRLLERSAAVLCDCAWVGIRLVEHGARRDTLVQFVWGIDLERFVPPAGAEGPRVVFVTTRSFEYLYGHDVIIDAYAASVAGRPGTELQLYGDGSRRAALQTRIDRLGLTERASLRPPTPEPELADVLQGATAWLNATSTDGASISMLQAIGCGTAVVTTMLPCAEEAAGPAPVRWYRPGDVDALTEHLLRVERPSAAEVATGRAHLQSVADWRRNARTYADAVAGACR